MQWHRADYTIDTDRDRLDVDTIATWLQSTYWAAGRSTDAVRRSWAASIPFGLYAGQAGDELIGCARVVTDGVVNAYPADVYLFPAHRGHGLGRWLVETILAHPDLQTVRWLLHTRDAHALYQDFGFQPAGDSVMERPRPQPNAAGT